jgi:hypothetical protein
MLLFGRGFAVAANSFANPKYVNPFVLQIVWEKLRI